MCIIVAKPMDVAMPDTDTLFSCFESNPDGAGFMWADGKSVHIRKGFMTWEDFEEALDAEIPGQKRKELAIVMHFRIATHGKVQPMCCHPFPVSSSLEDLQRTRCESRFGIAHNGIIQGRTTNDKRSDTMDFVMKVVAPLAKMNANFMRNSHALDLLEGACGSKLAILENSGELVTVGDFVEDEGILYSNTSYLTWSKRYSSYGSLFSGSGYTEAYGEYLDDFIDMLPWMACKECANAEFCAMDYPECESENIAHKMSAYMNGWDDEWIVEDEETAVLVG